MKKLITIILIIALILPAPALMEENTSPVTGKWSCYFDIASLGEAYLKVMSYSLMVYDLYLFENGSAYMTNLSIDKKTGKPDFSFGALDGVWIGDSSDMTIKVGSQTYKASISEDGYLLLYMTKSVPMAFVRVDTTGKIFELLQD